LWRWGLLLLLFKSKRKIKIKIKIRYSKRLAVLILLAMLLVVFLAPDWVLPPFARYLDVSESPRPVDYVLVLNGDPETRPFAAAALVKTGLAKKVLLTSQRIATESATVQDGAMPSELEITRRVLELRGVPKDAIQILPGDITSTAEEAAALAIFLEANPEATVGIVTNAFHTRRARMAFQRLLGEHAARVAFFGIPRDGADPDSWWRHAHGCGVHLSEYCKLPYYWLKY
jgi:uncharacterized SAM-binding protein YcdF (DUF218 family)